MERIDFCFNHKPTRYVSVFDKKITSRCKFCNKNIILTDIGDWIGYYPNTFRRRKPYVSKSAV